MNRATRDSRLESRILLVVAAALVDQDNHVLLARRPQGKMLAGMLEFPGGKVEAGEMPEQALIRELHEELGIGVASADLEPLSFISHAYPEFHLVMPLYLCRRWTGTPQPHASDELLWIAPDDLPHPDMTPADAPLVAALKRWL